MRVSDSEALDLLKVCTFVAEGIILNIYSKFGVKRVFVEPICLRKIGT